MPGSAKHRYTQRLVTLGVIAALAVAASGCGGSSQTKKANEEWAKAVCTNIGVWKKLVHDAATSLNPFFGPVARLHQAIGATRQLAKELEDIGLPKTEQGAKAKQQYEQLWTNLQTQLTRVENSAEKLKSGDIYGALALIGELKTATSTAITALDDLRTVASPDLALAIAETGACQALHGD